MIQDMFPPELAALCRWVCWRLEPDPKGGKDRKTPYCPATGRRASVTDPASWATLDDAAAAVGKYSGVGFVFTEDAGIVGVDIDHCIDPITGAVNDTAAAILAKIPATFIEVSQSGSGLHIYLHGTMPPGGHKNSKAGVEMYGTARYFAATGDRWKDAPPVVAQDNGALAWIHANYVAKAATRGEKSVSRKKHKASQVRLNDEEILEKAAASDDGETFKSLWCGNWHETHASQSEADLSLCRKLAFWTGKDAEQMDRMFRRSGLFRPKWDERHHASGATYGGETVARAIEQTEEIYNAEGVEGISIWKGRYMRGKKDRQYILTNFVLEPLEMVLSENESAITAVLVNTRGDRHRFPFSSGDFSTLSRFKNVLNRQTIDLCFFGGEGDLEPFKDYISGLSWERKTGVKALGIYEHGGRPVFVETEGAVEAGGAAVDDIVQLERYKGIVSTILSWEPLDADGLKQLGPLLMEYNEPSKTVPVLAWSAACFLKPHLRQAGIKFPHLFLVGEAGSGKSNTLEHVILPIFSRSKVTAAPQVTAFTLMKESASSNTLPQTMDEFKPSKIEKFRLNALYNHFRDVYDGHEGLRGHADRTVEVYELSAPLVVAGEEAADETAIRERSVELLFSKKDLKAPERRTAFKQLCAKPSRVSRFGRALLDTALHMAMSEAGKLHKAALKMLPEEFPERVVSNLACCETGLCLVERLCSQLGLSWNEVFPLDRDTCREHLVYAAREYLLDGGTHNKSVVEQSLEIMSRMGLAKDTEYTFERDGSVLYLWLNQSYDLLTKYCKDHAVVTELLTYPQFKRQLIHSDFFIACNVPKRLGGQLRKVWTLNFNVLKSRCDVEGFGDPDLEPEPL